MLARYKKRLSSAKNFLKRSKKAVEIIERVDAEITNGKVYLDPFEKNFIYICYKDLRKFLTVENINNLLNNLDAESRKNVFLLISRVLYVLENNLEQYDVLTQEEIAETLDLRKSRRFITKLNDDCYFYNGYLLPINHFEINIFYKHYVPEIIRKKFDTNSIIVDAGAFIGDTAVFLAELNPKEIYCFEANINNIKILKSTIKLNKLKNIQIVNKALGAKEGYVYLSDDTSCSTEYSEQKDLKVEETSLDIFFKNFSQRIGLIKADVEGAEPQLVEGAVEILRRDKPLLMLSIYHNPYQLFTIKKFIEDLNLGYKFIFTKPSPTLIVLETMLLGYVEES